MSQEFLLQLRAHLSPYGIIMYNTTDSDIVNKTGLSTFPYGWRVYNSLILSDAPMPIDRTRLLKTLSAYRIDNKLVFDLSRATDTAALARIAGEFDPAQEFSTSTLLEDREHYLARLMGVPILTDDNMLIEWLRPK